MASTYINIILLVIAVLAPALAVGVHLGSRGCDDEVYITPEVNQPAVQPWRELVALRTQLEERNEALGKIADALRLPLNAPVQLIAGMAITKLSINGDQNGIGQ